MGGWTVRGALLCELLVFPSEYGLREYQSIRIEEGRSGMLPMAGSKLMLIPASNIHQQALHQPLTPILRSNPSDGRILQIFSSAKTAMENLHASGWVHRDLKPDNLVLEVQRGEDGSCEVTSRVLLIDVASAAPINAREWTVKRKSGVQVFEATFLGNLVAKVTPAGRDRPTGRPRSSSFIAHFE